MPYVGLLSVIGSRKEDPDLLLHLALRNFQHNLARWLLACLGISLAVFLISVSLAGISVLRREGLRPVREWLGGDIVVLQGTWKVYVTDQAVRTNLDALRPFDAAVPAATLDSAGLRIARSILVPAYFYGGERKIVLLGRSPAEQAPHMPIDEGRYFIPDDTNEAVLVVRSAHRIGTVGSVQRLRLARYDQNMSWDLTAGSDHEFTVIGVSNRQIGMSAPVAPLEFLQAAAGTNAVTWLSVDVLDYSRLNAIRNQVSALLPAYEVVTAEEILALVDVDAARLQQSAVPLTAMIFLVGSISVLSTIMLLTQLRRREMALMKVLGMSSSQIALCLVLESASALTGGAFLGYLLGSYVGAGLGRFGLGLSLLSSSYVLALVAIIALVTTFPPAIGAARHTTLEVLRNV